MAKRLPEFLRPAEAEAMVKAADSERDKLILLIGLAAGLRCAEIVHLRIEDIDLAEQTIFVRLGKGARDRYVCVPELLAAALRSWIGERQSGWLFPSPLKEGRPLTTRAVQYLAGRMRKAAGILRRANPHVWRHSYACDLLRSGALLTEISQLLGHSSPSVTAAYYLHCDVSRLKGAVSKLSLAGAESARIPADSSPASQSPPPPPSRTEGAT